QAPYERRVDVPPRLSARRRLDVAGDLGSRGERETRRCRERRGRGRTEQHGGEHRQEQTFWFHRRTPPLESDWSRLYWGVRGRRGNTRSVAWSIRPCSDSVRRLNLPTVSETSCRSAPGAARTRLLRSRNAPP